MEFSLSTLQYHNCSRIGRFVNLSPRVFCVPAKQPIYFVSSSPSGVPSSFFQRVSHACKHRKRRRIGSKVKETWEEMHLHGASERWFRFLHLRPVTKKPLTCNLLLCIRKSVPFAWQPSKTSSPRAFGLQIRVLSFERKAFFSVLPFLDWKSKKYLMKLAMCWHIPPSMNIIM